ncbi:MAG: hypothetical protein DRG09_00625 [Epsilonproteobacteria bacterium]|nr:MAG: hypothetical protein DRG09_00625 [Campylobacterota bacterium]
MKYLSLLLSLFVLLSFTACDSPSMSEKKVHKEYFTGGQLRSEFIMDDKTGQNGILKKYGYSGHLTSTSMVQNGVPNGVETGYDPEGRVLWRQYYVNGRQEGLQKAYYPNGDLMVTYTYKNGVKSGVAQTYRKDGKVDKRVIYRNGRIVN